MQRTLAQSLHIEGIGLHSGCKSVLHIKPAPVGTGIVFKRTDLSGAPEVPALYSNVVDTRNCTCLQKGEAVVSTIEHLMAALSVLRIDNALIEVDNREVPIMDGSGLIFYNELRRVGAVEQNAPEKILRILNPVSFDDGKGGSVTLSPADNLSIRFEIDFPSLVVGHQVFDAEITPEIFASRIAPCRTFCEKSQVDYLQSLGLIKGGSLENAVVLDNDKILNPEGFRVPDECVSHKVMDAVGDLYTSGYHILGRLSAIKSGHYHNNELLKKLFSNPSDYELL